MIAFAKLPVSYKCWHHEGCCRVFDFYHSHSTGCCCVAFASSSSSSSSSSWQNSRKEWFQGSVLFFFFIPQLFVHFRSWDLKTPSWKRSLLHSRSPKRNWDLQFLVCQCLDRECLKNAGWTNWQLRLQLAEMMKQCAGKTELSNWKETFWWKPFGQACAWRLLLDVDRIRWLAANRVESRIVAKWLLCFYCFLFRLRRASIRPRDRSVWHCTSLG